MRKNISGFSALIFWLTIQSCKSAFWIVIDGCLGILISMVDNNNIFERFRKVIIHDSRFRGGPGFVQAIIHTID